MTPEEIIEQKRARKCAKNKRYWERHREEICEKRNVKVECPTCGKQVPKRHLDRHLQRLDHTKSSEDLTTAGQSKGQSPTCRGSDQKET